MRPPPLRDLGADPGTGKQVLVKEGRFGPYVTDGETNATLRRGDAPETITIERAAELLGREAGQGPRPEEARSQEDRRRRRKTTKKAAKKTTTKTR